MPRFLMTISFDGTNYHGWQVQSNAITIQPTIQDAFELVIGYRPNITGCSRTDSGVHALKYCFHFDYDGKIACENLVKALNRLLPKDIVATQCVQVNDDFHARYSALSKQYIYKIYNGKVANPFLNGYSYQIRKPLNEKLMDKAAKEFIGTYDFKGFCSSNSSVQDTVRTVFNASVERQDDLVTFMVEADGFLYNMVRIMTGTLISVSSGKIDANQIAEIIKSKDRNRAGITAPADGLYLKNIVYKDL